MPNAPTMFTGELWSSSRTPIRTELIVCSLVFSMHLGLVRLERLMDNQMSH